MKTRAASTRRARSKEEGEGKREEGAGRKEKGTLNSQRSTATGDLKPETGPLPDGIEKKIEEERAADGDD